MKEQKLFADGSVDTQLKIGYGAYLLLTDVGHSLPILKLKNKVVKTRRFENTSSTKLELQTLLWALEDIQTVEEKITIYTDSQNIVRLPARRKRLEENDYYTSKNKLLRNHELYQEFFRITDSLDFSIVKVRGHRVSSDKNEIDQFFSLVDKASRRALRERRR